MTAHQTENFELGILKLGCFWGPFLGPQNRRKNEVDQLDSNPWQIPGLEVKPLLLLILQHSLPHKKLETKALLEGTI